MLAPVVFADKSIATLRSDVMSAPVAPIAPLFSISETVPDRSRIAVALPSPAWALTLIVPLLRMVESDPPVSTTMAVDFEAGVPPPAAEIAPELRISGVDAPLPIRIAVALAPFDDAWTVPETPMPPAIDTVLPSPPTTRPLPSTPA